MSLFLLTFFPCKFTIFIFENIETKKGIFHISIFSINQSKLSDPYACK